MACTKCNDCKDLGCKKIVYPDCILTKVEYPCLGLTAAGKTGTELFSAIDSEICSIKASVITINGTLTTINTTLVGLQECCDDNSAAITALVTNETWKNIGAVGTMANGQNIPSFSVGAAAPGSGLRIAIRMQGGWKGRDKRSV